MSWPRRVRIPVRVISRRLVTVYVVVSQPRKGLITNQAMTRNARPQMTTRSSGPSLPLGKLATNPAAPATTSSTNAGPSNALTWVRIETTTNSSSLSSLREIATCRSCHASGSGHRTHMDHVTRAERPCPRLTADQQPPVDIDPRRLAEHLLPRRKVYPHLPAEGRAASYIGVTQTTARIAEVSLPLDEQHLDGAKDLAQDHRAIERLRVLQGERGRSGHGQLIAGRGDVQPHPDDGGAPAGALDTLDQTPGHLLVERVERASGAAAVVGVGLNVSSTRDELPVS